MDLFSESEQKVLGFMEQVQDIKDREAEDRAFQNTTDYKLKCLNREQQNAKGVCLDKVFSQLYKNALPLNDGYKVAHGEDLDADMKDFFSARCPKGLDYYIHECIKRGSKPAARIMEAVENMVDDEYNQKAMKIEDYDVKDLVFRMDDDQQRKIDIINQDLNLDDLSQIVRDNVKSTVQSEIERAKKEKEDLQQLEAELANDMKVADEAAIEHELLLRGYTEKKDFEPTIFQGIMIGKTSAYEKLQESGQFTPEYTYEALQEFGYNYESVDGQPLTSTIEEMAFIESVKELTKLSIIRSLKMESFTPNDIREMALKYAEY